MIHLKRFGLGLVAAIGIIAIIAIFASAIGLVRGLSGVDPLDAIGFILIAFLSLGFIYGLGLVVEYWSNLPDGE